MINVPDAVKNKFKNGSSQKDLIISYNGVDGLNFYKTDEVSSIGATISESYGFSFIFNDADYSRCYTKKYICFSLYYKITQITQSVVENIKITLGFTINNDGSRYKDFIVSPNVMADYVRIYAVFDISEYDLTKERSKLLKFSVLGLSANTGYVEIRVKNAKVEFVNSSTSEMTEYSGYLQYPTAIDFESIANDNLIAQSFSLTESLCSEDNLKFGVCEASYIEFECFNSNNDFKNAEIKAIIDVGETATVPLGCYTVKNITKQSNRKRTKITAYDKSTLLDVNAEDWYSSYMFGVDFSTYIESGFQFPRQIYATYWNIANYLNIELDEYDKTLLTSKTRAELTSLLDSNINVAWDNYGANYTIRYSKILAVDVDYTKLHQVFAYPTNTYDYDFAILQAYNYTNKKDSLGRGFNAKGTVLVEELNASNAVINSFCCDSGDYFKLSDATVKINLYVPYGLYNNVGTKLDDAVDFVEIYEVDNSVYLINGATKLVYYNYGTKDIFASPSGITARQVAQSLLEVCGCFFMIDRYGYPSFVYCTKTSLYPSDTLYPADTIYPRGADETTTKSLYEKFYFEDYTVLDYGKIQIKKNSSDNVTSICEWEYVGDADKENTYIIEDNVFYCSDSMIYDFDNMPEVYDMLVNMFSVISNMSYIPHETVCKGLPYLEVGDRISLLTDTGGIETFIFRRTLNGIQALKDNYTAVGDEKTDEINSYGYTLWGG